MFGYSMQIENEEASNHNIGENQYGGWTRDHDWNHNARGRSNAD